MYFSETSILSAKLVDPSPREDDRGRFMRAWCIREFSENGVPFVPVQANMGFIFQKGTVRGMPGFLFDLGPHISFTKGPRIQELFASSIDQRYETLSGQFDD
jgi:hypothetical protein